ncbi:unnamed protein product [Thelazia callipaeda]|uniref:MIF4G domain-containing protein n=1 Tax=Thelazia callipaeda TaxID=103827 RepID=A0A0N5CYS5_THECL|nr:unnamed protein product [Thelazia callipaeda]
MVDMDEERLQIYIRDLERRTQSQVADRTKLKDAIPLSETQLRKMDSTLKKTTAFLKKLKNFGTAQFESLLQDIEKVNLSKFLEEMAKTVADIKLKYSDVQAIVNICVHLSCYYEEFSRNLLLEFRKLLPVKRNDKIQNPSKLRVDIRLLGELCLHGVFQKDGLQLLGSALAFLTLTDKTDHLNIPILLPFCKTMNADLLGLHPYSVKQFALAANVELPETTVLPGEHQKPLAQLLLDYHDLHEMNHLLLSVKRQIRNRGDASSEDKNQLEEVRVRYEKILTCGIQLSEFLGLEMEEMKEEQSEDEEEEISALALSRALQEGTITIWPDEDTRQFYETRMELRELVPAILFQESEKRTLDLVEREIEDVDLSGLESISEEPEEEVDGHVEGVEEEEEVNTGSAETYASVAVKQAEGQKMTGLDLKVMINAFMEELPWLINRDLIDQAALNFVTNLNTKNNRRKLCQMMLEQHQNRLDLLPFYGRLVATLEPVMPDLALELSHSLLRQFRASVKNRTEYSLSRKLRCCRFISELVKFGTIPKAEGLTCLRMVLFDFRGHNIDMCCTMVDAMGQFLYRSTDSHGKMKTLLEVMMKKRERINDTHKQMIIDNAFFTCIPPPLEEKPKAESDPVHDFICYLLSSLSRCRMEITLRCFRKLDWADPELANFAVGCLSNPSLPRYSSIPHLASLIAALSSYHDWIGIRVLDATLEDIRIALEMNSFSFNQSLVLSVMLLGQLYNYSVCDSPIIFKTLYQLITFGAFDPLLDNWNNLARINLVCDLLLVCGEYFNSGSAKSRLDCFLAYFYRYFVVKEEAFKVRNIAFPKNVRLYVRFRVEEMNDYVRKDTKIPDSFDEAQKAIDIIQQRYKNAMESSTRGESLQTVEDMEEEEEEPRKRQLITDAKDEEIGSSENINALVYDDNEQVNVHTSHISQPEDELFVQTSAGDSKLENISNSKTETKMAILTRGKGNKTVLKAIAMDIPDSLTKIWNAQREKERQELTVHKHITLSMNERMMMDADSDSLSD